MDWQPPCALISFPQEAITTLTKPEKMLTSNSYEVEYRGLVKD